MAGPIEIIITQGGGGNYSSPTLNNVYNQPAIATGQTGVGRGSQLMGEGQLLGKPFGTANAALTSAAVVAMIQVAQSGISFAAQVIKTQASLQAQLSGDYVASNSVQQYTDLQTRAVNFGLDLAKKVVAGAGIGAVLGSVVPGLGTAAGGAVGAAAGGVIAALGIAKKVYTGITNIESRLNELKIDYITTEQMSIRAGMPFGSNSRNTRY